MCPHLAISLLNPRNSLKGFLAHGCLEGSGVRKSIPQPLPCPPLPLTPRGYPYPCSSLETSQLATQLYQNDGGILDDHIGPFLLDISGQMRSVHTSSLSIGTMETVVPDHQFPCLCLQSPVGQ